MTIAPPEKLSAREPASILILRMSSLGDIIHALPAVAAIRRRYPNAHLGWALEKGMTILLRENSLVDEIHIVDTRGARTSEGWARGTAQVWRSLRSIRSRRYEWAVDFQGLYKSAVIGRLAGVKHLYGFRREYRREPWSAWLLTHAVDPGSDRKHVIAENMALAGACGAGSTTWEFPLPDTTRQEAHVSHQLKRLPFQEFAVVNPGAGWPTKIWDIRKFAELAVQLHDKLALPSIVTWGPGEEALADQITRHAGHRKVVTFQTSFLELVPLLKRARVFIGGDTGPMQLAAALQVPIVALFGPTDPIRNGPFRPEDVTVHRPLFCSSCYLRKCPYHLECLEIEVSEVFAAVERRLGLLR